MSNQKGSVNTGILALMSVVIFFALLRIEGHLQTIAKNTVIDNAVQKVIEDCKKMSKYRKGVLYIRRANSKDKTDSFMTAFRMAYHQVCGEKKSKPWG